MCSGERLRVMSKGAMNGVYGLSLSTPALLPHLREPRTRLMTNSLYTTSRNSSHLDSSHCGNALPVRGISLCTAKYHNENQER